MLALFALALFVSATLLFLVQPMFAKMALPLLGGTPAVWNTCMVFYQAALLGGYAYAHGVSRLPLGRQAVLHAVLLLVPLALLPVAVPADAAPPVDANPIPWLLRLLALTVGLPFFVVSTTAPLLQRWFAHTGHPAAKDPYFLYAASNAGSMVALLSYPFAIEPLLRLTQQTRAWAVGYGLFAALVATCGFVAWKARRATTLESADAPEEAAAPSMAERLRWIALAAVPSSLLLGVTTHLSTDIASVPLLWIAPLALYLLTFIIVFSRRPLLRHRWMLLAQPPLILALTVVFFFTVEHVVALLVPLHVAAFFVTAMVCHGELAARRPSARRLTEYYLWMSFGGVVGGLFNAFVAPLAFKTTMEYEIAILAACLLRPPGDAKPAYGRMRLLDLALVTGVCAAMLLTLFAAVKQMGGAMAFGVGTFIVTVASIVYMQVRRGGEAAEPSPLRTRFLDFYLPACLCMAIAIVGMLMRNKGVVFFMQVLLIALAVTTAYSFVRRPLRFALGVLAVIGASAILSARDDDVIHRARSFFSVMRVKRNDLGCHVLVHGSTTHGAQSREAGREREPLTYYHPGTLIGVTLNAYRDRTDRPIAAVGLGAATVAAYGVEGQEWDFFEIDPAVVRIARDPALFTYLRDCPAKVNVVLGDARLTLARASDGRYGLIILDAFSSDAVPVHLLTREALALYLRKTKEDGIIAFHVSSRYLDLHPVLGALARDAGLVTLKASSPSAGTDALEYSADWVMMARRKEDWGELNGDARWRELETAADARAWTDDFSNIVGAFKLRK